MLPPEARFTGNGQWAGAAGAKRRMVMDFKLDRGGAARNVGGVGEHHPRLGIELVPVPRQRRDGFRVGGVDERRPARDVGLGVERRQPVVGAGEGARLEPERALKSGRSGAAGVAIARTPGSSRVRPPADAAAIATKLAALASAARVTRSASGIGCAHGM